MEGFCRRPPDSDLLEINDAQILPIGRDQTTGPTTGGYLRVCGLLRPTTWMPGLEPHTISSWIFDNIVVHFGIRVVLDESPSVAVLPPKLCWIPVSRYSYSQCAIIGLILESTGKKDTEFRRRGMFEIWDDKLFVLMLQRRKGTLAKEEQQGVDFVYDPDEWEDVPKTDLTIV